MQNQRAVRRSSLQAVVIYGPPGSGKGTQAELIAKKIGGLHFDTGQYLRTILYDPNSQNDKIIQRERKLNAAGVLNTPSWILKIMVDVIKKAADLRQSMVFSGSPRTFYEAFGYNQGENQNGKTEGVMEILKKYYAKENIFVFIFKLSLKDSIKRINGRLTCSVCNGPLLAQKINLNPARSAAEKS